MAEQIWREFLPVDSIQITNTHLDEKYINLLTADLKAGLLKPEDLGPLFIRLEGRGYFANDGNHRLSALKRVGVEKVLADIYTLDD